MTLSYEDFDEEQCQWVADLIAGEFHAQFCEAGGCTGECREAAEAFAGIASRPEVTA